MKEESPEVAPPKCKRRWFQFSLRTLLIFTLVIAAACAWLGRAFHQAAEQEALIDAAQKVGGRIEVAYSGPDWFAFFCPRRLRRQAVGLSFDLSAEGDCRRDDVLSCLAGFRRIKWLDLGVQPVDEEGLRHIGQMDQLTRLTMTDSSITEAGAAQLAQLPNLQELNLSGCHIDNAVIGKLADCPHLKKLMLRRAVFEDEPFNIARLRGLWRLDLADCDYPSKLYGEARLGNWLNGLDTLEELYLCNWPTERGDMRSISRLKKLRILDLTGCRVGGSELRPLANLQELRNLGLAPKSVDDETVQILRKLSHLETLSVHEANLFEDFALSISADGSSSGTPDKLPRVDGQTSEKKHIPIDFFFHIQLPVLKRALPLVQIDTGIMSYPEIRCQEGQRVVSVPDLVEEQEQGKRADGGTF